MKLPKLVFFDVGGTLLKNIDFSLERAIFYLYNEIYEVNESFTSFLSDFKNLYKAFDSINNVCFSFSSYLNYLDANYVKKTNLNHEEIELTASRKAYQIEKIEQAKLVLDFLNEHNIPLFVFSNSMFSSCVILDELEKISYSKYFKGVYSSADHLFKKPSSFVFMMMIKKASQLGISKEEVCYIGNTLELDILPSIKQGIKSVYLGTITKEHPDYQEIANYEDLLKIWRNYEYESLS